MRNLITDVPGMKVGHAEDLRLGSGATAIIFDQPAAASIDVRGGGPGTRETALLDPAQTVEGIDAITLAGGSAFGLDAASGVQAWLKEQGRGFAVRTARVPIVPAAILFDLLSGGDKDWGRYPPYRELGYAAAAAASPDFPLGSVGAGTGATTVNCKGGIGSASAGTAEGHVVGALAAVNAVGSVTIGDGPWFWAAPFERAAEFGGLLEFGFPPRNREIMIQQTIAHAIDDDVGFSPFVRAGEAPQIIDLRIDVDVVGESAVSVIGSAGIVDDEIFRHRRVGIVVVRPRQGLPKIGGEIPFQIELRQIGAQRLARG